MVRSNQSTLVKRWPNPSQTPTQTLWCPCRLENFCRVLQISPKHFKFSQYKSCAVCRGTQLSCWLTFAIRSGIVWKNCFQCLQLLFIDAQKICKLACFSFKIAWGKPHTAFIKVVEGSEIYNFYYYHLVHFYCKIWRKQQSNSATLICFAPGRTRTPRARDVALGHVGSTAVHRCTRTPRRAYDRWFERRALAPVRDTCGPPG
jgi:hypothetical protein